MKIRMGFVTNSSSSSFIVAFDKEINTLGEQCFGSRLAQASERWRNGEVDEP